MQTLLTGRAVPGVSTDALMASIGNTRQLAANYGQGAAESLGSMRTAPPPRPATQEEPWWRAPAPGSEGGANGSARISDDLSKYGFADNVPRSLIGTESGGNWAAQNGEVGAGGKAGHYGILQFGNARLEDAKRAGAIPVNMTPQQFMASPDAQVAAANWHFSDIDRRIVAQGYDRYVGQTVGGVPITMDGMRSMAHLGGFGGLSKFISSGGGYNPADSFGTSLAAYGKTHQSY